MGTALPKISKAFSINHATLSGALDIVVIAHEDGTMKSSPFHVRFGKLQLLQSIEKVVEIKVNGRTVPITMKLSDSGKAYFVSRLQPEEEKTTLMPPDRFSRNCTWHWDLDKPKNRKSTELLPVQGDFCSDVSSEPDDEFRKIEFSLCKDLLNEADDVSVIFQRHKVSYEVYCSDPWSLFSDPQLVVRLNDKLYDWKAGLPILMSMLAYDQPIGVTESKPKLEKHNSRPKEAKYMLTTDELRALKLRPGPNAITFTVTSTIQGSKDLHATIFLWSFQSKLIVSDIDGTITRSDFLGHVMPVFGNDWAQPGIVALYHALSMKGYKFIYLTSRPIGQVAKTRKYLAGLTQDGLNLPSGPVITSPDRMYKSLMREVVYRKPQVFKANALKEILDLFPQLSEPFYAGFGNRDTDAIAYRAVGVPLSRIYIVDSKNQVLVYDKKTYRTDYAELTTLVDDFFPGISGLISH